MQSRRIELEREISIRVPAFDSFVTEYSSNISTTGMFIRSEKPLPSDTQISFEFRIADDWKLIRGKAQVIWTRYRDEGPDHPAGMGVLFTELEPQSRRLIGWIIEKHVRDGGTPFELGAPGEMPSDFELAAAEPRPAPEPTASTPPPGRRAEARHLKVERPRAGATPEPVRFRLGPLILAGLAVTLVLAGLFWLSERGAQSVANPDLEADEAPAEKDAGPAAAASEPAGPGEAEPAPETSPEAPARAPRGPEGPAARQAGGSTPPASPPPAATTPTAGLPPATPQSAVSPVFVAAAERLVDGWAQAWSGQDVDAYLAYYSRNFRPADGRSRSAWAAGRRQRLEAPEFIEISVANLEAEVSGDARGRVAFDQGYRSNTFQDSVRKVMELVREDGRWKILEEKTAG